MFKLVSTIKLLLIYVIKLHLPCTTHFDLIIYIITLQISFSVRISEVTFLRFHFCNYHRTSNEFMVYKTKRLTRERYICMLKLLFTNEKKNQ